MGHPVRLLAGAGVLTTLGLAGWALAAENDLGRLEPWVGAGVVVALVLAALLALVGIWAWVNSLLVDTLARPPRHQRSLSRRSFGTRVLSMLRASGTDCELKSSTRGRVVTSSLSLCRRMGFGALPYLLVGRTAVKG